MAARNRNASFIQSFHPGIDFFSTAPELAGSARQKPTCPSRSPLADEGELHALDVAAA
jgi:hypothetical protein